MTGPRKSRRKRDLNPRSSVLEADVLPLGQRGGLEKQKKNGCLKTDCSGFDCLNCLSRFVPEIHQHAAVPYNSAEAIRQHTDPSVREAPLTDTRRTANMRHKLARE